MTSLVPSYISEWLPFAYDFRRNPSDVAVDLLPVIKAMAARYKTGKVTLIGHSLGGLVAKELLWKLTQEHDGTVVDNLVLVAVPQAGLPKAIPGMLHGKFLGQPLEDINVYVMPEGSHVREAFETAAAGAFLLPSPKGLEWADQPRVIDFIRPKGPAMLAFFEAMLAKYGTPSPDDRSDRTLGIRTYGTLGSDGMGMMKFLSDNLIDERWNGSCETVLDTRGHFNADRTGEDYLWNSSLYNYGKPNRARSIQTDGASAYEFHGRLDSWIVKGARTFQIVGVGLPTTIGITYSTERLSAGEGNAIENSQECTILNGSWVEKGKKPKGCDVLVNSERRSSRGDGTVPWWSASAMAFAAADQVQSLGGSLLQSYYIDLPACIYFSAEQMITFCNGGIATSAQHFNIVEQSVTVDTIIRIAEGVPNPDYNPANNQPRCYPVSGASPVCIVGRSSETALRYD